MESRLTRFGGRALLPLLLLGWFFPDPAAALGVERHALVIGNSSYPDGALNNPSNDANSVAVLLRDLNFDVVLEKDLDYKEMLRAIGDFEEKLTDGSLAVFYFAGHGTSKDRINYLIPIASSENFEKEAISVDSIVRRLEATKSSSRIIILDACRAPPEPRNSNSLAAANPVLTRGFAPTNKHPPGTLIAYATAPGEVASDGTRGENGVFTAALLEQLEVPGLEITEVIREARKTVYYSTDGEQNPHSESSLMEPVYLRPESPRHCLDLLPEPGSANAVSPRLGRVWWKKQILEPVLVWPGDEGYQFRGCFGRESIVAQAMEAEFFESALITRFHKETIDAIPQYRHVRGLGYAPDGEAELIMGSAGHMLEAHRKEGDYVEVVGSASVGIIQGQEPILMIASRQAMVEMDLQVWDLPWGARAEDNRVGREIIWWQLGESGELFIHPAVRSFADLAQRLAVPGESAAESSWESALEEYSEAVLSHAAYSLLVADTVAHIDFAEALHTRAEELDSATLDIAMLENPEKLKEKRWEEHFERLEATATRGRLWLLGRRFDLAAILPERIAGQVRFAYLKSNETAAASEDKFLNEKLILQASSPEFRLANALYLDHITTMTKRADFLECLLDGGAYGAAEVSEVLGQGLVRMGQKVEDWPQTTGVDTAFRRLFFGLDLPKQLPIADNLFKGSVRRQSSDLLTLVQSLKSSLQGIPAEEANECQIALLPDSALLDPAGGGLPEIVPAPSPFNGKSLNSDTTVARAQEAKDAVRQILGDLIHVKGARHTREQMMKGYKALDRGNVILRELEDGGDEVALQEALEELTKAYGIFNKAYEEAFRAEHTKPRVRVH